MSWTSREDLEGQVRRLWDRGRLLVPRVQGEPPFPIVLRLRRPDSRAMSERFDEVRGWIRALEDGSKARRGFGYEIRWAELDHRQLGPNRVPDAISVPTREDALRLVGRQRQAALFDELAEATRRACPALDAWVARRPMVMLDHAREWERILAVVTWLRAHTRPALYVRQLDIPGVDTKFIESRKGLLTELLNLALPPQAVDVSAGRNFEARYGFRSKPPLVRFRALDPRQRVAGLSDLTIPVSQLTELVLPARRVFITENEINGLAFPDLSESIVIFGLGYGVDRLAEVRWLRDRTIHYWGDVDTHGFAILSRLRAYFPEARSLLMDRETLLHHRELWGQEDARHQGSPERLTPEERKLFEDLADDRMGERVRLEQERIAFGWVEHALAGVADVS